MYLRLNSKGLLLSIPIKNLVVHTNLHPSIYPNVCTATFEDLRSLYKSDISNVIKRAHKLISKACWPSRLERQNVNLALRIFHQSTYCGLTAFKIEKGIENDNQTVEFLKVIRNIWDVFNVNWVGKDVRFNNEHSAPLSPNDSRLTFIQEVVDWLNFWTTLPTKFGKLTPQTFTSLKHT